MLAKAERIGCAAVDMLLQPLKNTKLRGVKVMYCATNAPVMAQCHSVVQFWHEVSTSCLASM